MAPAITKNRIGRTNQIDSSVLNSSPPNPLMTTSEKENHAREKNANPSTISPTDLKYLPIIGAALFKNLFNIYQTNW